MKIKNRKLFFAYALPCLEDLIKKGKISKKKAKSMISDYKAGKLLEGCERVFETALFFLEKIAKKMGKKYIDEEVIRKYFQEYHNKILEKGKSLEKCKIKFGKVIRIGRNCVWVKVNGKNKKYKTFLDDLKEGDNVVLHWDYIVDKAEKTKVLVFGNPLVKKDNLALKVASKLKHLPNFEFKEFDTVENLEKEGKNIIILDVIDGLKKVEVINDLNKIKKNKIFSLHDFDLSYELEMLKRLRLIESFKIIGIPPNLEEKKILKQVKEILFDPFYF
jgi:Ni,Fe-hydrogenase maturation factor